MTIAGFATGCSHGWVYLRGEYPRALDTLEAALVAARARGYLGDDILGSGFAFDITMFRGAGAYICGEETAIFNSVEGFRGEPRNKPPFPVEVGLFGKPTARQQRRDARQRRPDRGGWRAGVRRARHRRVEGSQAVLRVGRGRPARRVRGRVRRHVARAARPGGRRTRWRTAAGDPAGRRGRRLRRSRRPRPAADDGGRSRRRHHARLGRRTRARRLGRPDRPVAPDRGVLPRRIVRAVRAVPRRHRAPGGSPRPPRHESAGGRPRSCSATSPR